MGKTDGSGIFNSSNPGLVTHSSANREVGIIYSIMSRSWEARMDSRTRLWTPWLKPP